MRVEAATRPKVTIDLVRVALKPPWANRNESVYFLPTLRGTVGSPIQAPQERFSEPVECSDSPVLSASAGQRQDHRVGHQEYVRMRRFNHL